MTDTPFADYAKAYWCQPEVVSRFGTVGQVFTTKDDISRFWVITAGHCVKFDSNLPPQPLPFCVPSETEHAVF